MNKSTGTLVRLFSLSVSPERLLSSLRRNADKYEVESGMLCLKSKDFVPTMAEDVAEQSAMKELHKVRFQSSVKSCLDRALTNVLLATYRLMESTFDFSSLSLLILRVLTDSLFNPFQNLPHLGCRHFSQTPPRSSQLDDVSHFRLSTLSLSRLIPQGSRRDRYRTQT